MASILARPLIGFVKLYRLAVSPWLGANCRFQPTCSEYAIECLETHGALRGSLLTLRRLSRCHRRLPPSPGTGA